MITDIDLTKKWTEPEVKALLQELQDRVLSNRITFEELEEVLDAVCPLPEPAPEPAFLPPPTAIEYGPAYIYALLDSEGRRAYIGRSTNPQARHSQILSGRVKSYLVRLWVTTMRSKYDFQPPMVVLEETDTLDWYSQHRTWVTRLQEKGEAYLNTL